VGQSFGILGQEGLGAAYRAEGNRGVDPVHRLHSDAQCPRLEEEDRVVTISRMLSGKRVRTRQALELAIAMFYRIIKTFLGYAWHPQEVCFMHDAPEHPESHSFFFDTRVRFNWDYDGIVCRAADLEKSIPTSDPAMARYLKEYFDSILPSARADVSETVRELVWVMLKSGSCSARHVAKHLGVHRRTINRRLASEGQSYSSILDAVRRDMVLSFVEGGRRPLNEIVGLLGFSELSTFSRWFRNRFGRNASEWRSAKLRGAHLNSSYHGTDHVGFQRVSSEQRRSVLRGDCSSYFAATRRMMSKYTLILIVVDQIIATAIG
jgi:AraC-like DNA-binding protein